MGMQILVWEDKHSTSYYDASTPEKLEEAARLILQVLTSDYGYIQDPGEDLSEWDLNRLDMELVNMEESEYAALPDKFRIPVEHEKKKYAKLKADLAERQEEYKTAVAVANGETVMEKFRRRDKWDDEEWAKFVEKWPEYPVHDGWMWRPVSAWSILQKRDGREYEHYNLENLVN